MTTHSPLFLLAALGALTHAGLALAAADTTEWTCKTCPFPKGASGTLEAGVGAASPDNVRLVPYSGVQDNGGYLVLGGSLSQRGSSGYYADLTASELGLDSRNLQIQSGHEGLYSLRLGYAELPRTYAQGALTPFLGSGSATLTLPGGYPGSSPANMPLASTLKPVDIGIKKKQFDASATLVAFDAWTYRVSFKHDVRNGTRPVTGAFFSTASQLVAPVDQVTDQLEISAAYATRTLQASLAYQISRFANGVDAVTWDNPFWPVTPGSSRGQLAQAPGNQLHQIVGSAAYQITPTLRASADFAVGRLTQDASYLAPTLNTTLAATVPSLPAASLDGRVDTFNGNLKVTAALSDNLRLTALYARDVRDNRTEMLSYPLVATDTFFDGQMRQNTPFDLTQDRAKLSADYRGIDAVKLSGGVEQDNRSRPYHEAVKTREGSLWVRLGVQPLENLTVALKVAHADRNHTVYGRTIWFGAPENPLLRKYNLADRSRDSAHARADLALGETLNLGLAVDYANDDYARSAIGLRMSRSVNLAADISAAITPGTQFSAFAQTESIQARQAGSQAWAAADWNALNKDRFTVVGVNLKHALIADVFDIGAEASVSRSSSDMTVATGASTPLFPSAKTVAQSLKLMASYKLQDNLWLNASFRHEALVSDDWRLDGVLPDTVHNLLSFGQQAAQYRVNLMNVSLRYRF